MPFSCCVCKKTTATKREGRSTPVSMYRFPANSVKRQLWLETFNLTESDITAHSRVCSRHFLGNSRVPFWIPEDQELNAQTSQTEDMPSKSGQSSKEQESTATSSQKTLPTTSQVTLSQGGKQEPKTVKRKAPTQATPPLKVLALCLPQNSQQSQLSLLLAAPNMSTPVTPVKSGNLTLTTRLSSRAKVLKAQAVSSGSTSPTGASPLIKVVKLPDTDEKMDTMQPPTDQSITTSLTPSIKSEAEPPLKQTASTSQQSLTARLSSNIESLITDSQTNETPVPLTDRISSRISTLKEKIAHTSQAVNMTPDSPAQELSTSTSSASSVSPKASQSSTQAKSGRTRSTGTRRTRRTSQVSSKLTSDLTLAVPDSVTLPSEIFEKNSSKINPTKDPITMEVCVDSVQSAINAERGGASRLELCSCLGEGGTTPTLGMLRIIRRVTKLPVYVMVRPRGGDFLYSDDEFQVMKEDIAILKEGGANGFVFGILTPGGLIDTRRMEELISLCQPLSVTFHRAFDMVKDPKACLETLITLGVDRLLTSGCEQNAMKGTPMIKKLVKQARKRISIMPGGGITEDNLTKILSGTGVKEFHCSARVAVESGMRYRNERVSMGGSDAASEYSMKIASEERIRRFVALAS